MTTASTVIGASLPAHALHVVIVLLGGWGLAALLLPHVLERHLPHRAGARGPASYARADLDDHARRVAELRLAVVSGTFLASTHRPRVPSSTAGAAREIEVAGERAFGVPLALVAGTTAAGIHAAVAPPHLAESPLFGAFFLIAAGAQLAWVAQLSTRPTTRLLALGIALQAALVVLWLVTRVTGLPFGLLPEPHPVGGWDVACAVWQSIGIVACVRVLRDGVPDRVPGWFAWHPTSRAAVGAAAVTLVLLTVIGAHS